MRLRHRFSGATAVVTLALQIAMTTAAMLSVCMERPHTHAGTAAPDCVMHHQESQASENHHQHQEHHADAFHESSRGTSSIACRCSADPLSFLVSDIGVITERSAIRVPTSAVAVITVFTFRIVDLHIPPHSPPPRPTLS